MSEKFEAINSEVAVDSDADREEGEEEGGEDEENQEEGGEYTLHFPDHVDPLDLVQDDTFGARLYQQCKRLEYEATSERKRKHFMDSADGLSARKSGEEDYTHPCMDEIMDVLGIKFWRKSKRRRRRGRKRRSKKSCNPEITQKIGDATLYYASGQYDNALSLLKDVVRISPNLADAYHILGIVYSAMGDRNKALNFYMIAAHLRPKDSSLWKLLVIWSTESGNMDQVMYCLSKAITADPEDMSLRFDRASLYVEFGDYRKAAETYEQILAMHSENVLAVKMAAKTYLKYGRPQRAVNVLEGYMSCNLREVDLSLVDLLVTLCMENNAHNKALEHVEHAQSTFSPRRLPINLIVKGGICHLHLGNMEKADILFMDLYGERTAEHACFISDVADTYMNLGFFESALKYYFLLKDTAEHDSSSIYFKIAECYTQLKEVGRAIQFFYQVLNIKSDHIDARVKLSSLLLGQGQEDEAIELLSPPQHQRSADNAELPSTHWWLNGKVKMKLAQIYCTKRKLACFVDTIFSCVHETLLIEDANYRAKRMLKKLGKKVLFDKVKVSNDHKLDNVFCGFKPLEPVLKKASRSKKFQKMIAMKEERQVVALAAGLDWLSDDSDYEPLPALKEPPLPDILKDEEHYQLILDLCKALASLQRYWEALQIINCTLKVARSIFSDQKKEELRSLGAQVAFNTTDPRQGYDYVRHVVQQHPYSAAAWNCYYKMISKVETRLSKHAKLLHISLGRGNQTTYDTSNKQHVEQPQSLVQLPEVAVREYLQVCKDPHDGSKMEIRLSKHAKFLHKMRLRYPDCVAPMIINGHQLSMISQHQAAAKEYLEAYRLQPENPFISLCVGTALINLALGFRLQNKNQCLVQGLAFLYNCIRLCPNSQEAFYNIARAYQQVGLVTLAAMYFEKVIAIRQKDYPVPQLPNEEPCLLKNPKPGYCDLRMEAAYNLHLIYKRSGALDLARQVLKDHCRP